MILFYALMLVMQNWVPAGSEARGSYEYDAASVSRPGNNARTRLRVTLQAAAPNGVRSVLMDVEFGCAARTITTYAITTYSDSGAVLESRQAGPSEAVAQPLPANTIEDGIRQRLCG